MNRIVVLLEKLNKQSCSQEELAELKQLMSEQEGKKMEDYLDKSLQTSSDSIENQHAEFMWQNIKAGINQGKNLRKIKPARRRLITWTSVAAVITLLVWVGSLLLLNNPQVKMLTIVNPKGAEVKLIMLPDSSQVWLNENSQLVYPEEFSKAERQVEMKGQAFYQIRRDIDHPFKVISNGIVTRVLGTSFDVQTLDHEGAVSIALFTGKVEVSRQKSNQRWRLSPNEAITIQGNKSQINHFDRDLLAIWRSQEMHFREHSLEEVLKVMEMNFKGKTIKVNDQKLLKESISGTFLKSDKLENILELICFSKGWNFKKITNNSFLIKH